MKKFLGLFSLLNIAMLLLASSALAAGTMTQSLTTVCEAGTINCTRVLTIVATADASAATYPSTAITTANMSKLKGWALAMGSTLNGATAPTALYDLTITEGGVDILGTAGYNRPGTAAVSSQFVPIKDTTYLTAGWRPITDTLTVAIANNSVNSASVTIKLFFFPMLVR